MRSPPRACWSSLPAAGQIDRPRLREHLGVSRLSAQDQEEGQARHGLRAGTMTPVAIGADAHGVNLRLDPSGLVRLLDADVANVTRPAG